MVEIPTPVEARYRYSVASRDRQDAARSGQTTSTTLPMSEYRASAIGLEFDYPAEYESPSYGEDA